MKFRHFVDKENLSKSGIVSFTVMKFKLNDTEYQDISGFGIEVRGIAANPVTLVTCWNFSHEQLQRGLYSIVLMVD